MLQHIEYARIDREGLAFISVDFDGSDKLFTRRKADEPTASPYAPPVSEERIADQVFRQASKPNGTLRIVFEALDFGIDWKR